VLYTAFLELKSQNVTKEKLREALLYEKFASKMLMKLTIGWSYTECVTD